ncbi:MAG: reverse transcriptase/maturase family protein [Bacteroidota bacterium]|nr:reverse transcriptase/maturase family protein [Bacteroidota bacterium]
MKRAGSLIEEITDLNNLYLAFYKASKTKQNNDDVILYKQNLYKNLLELQNQIETGKINTGNYKYFTIYEPKKRLICAASFPERVLHHALMNVCHPIFENQQLSISYATRVNKGTYKALEKALYYSFRNKYYLKLDIRKYFDSISHQILMKKLETIFKDPMLLYLFHQIIDSYQNPTGFKNSLDFTLKKGLPIGNLTSQYFANFYLADFDRFIKQNLHLKSYVRYMDDMLIWSNSAQELNIINETIQLFLLENLQLKLKYHQINTTKHGVNFLSYRIFNTHIELARKSKKRFIKKMDLYDKKLKTGELSQKDFQIRVSALIAFTNHASAKGFRKKVFGYEKKD